MCRPSRKATTNILQELWNGPLRNRMPVLPLCIPLVVLPAVEIDLNSGPRPKRSRSFWTHPPSCYWARLFRGYTGLLSLCPRQLCALVSVVGRSTDVSLREDPRGIRAGGSEDRSEGLACTLTFADIAGHPRQVHAVGRRLLPAQRAGEVLGWGVQGSGSPMAV